MIKSNNMVIKKIMKCLF